MSPKKFRKAREQKQKQQRQKQNAAADDARDNAATTRRYHHVTVEDRPYFPFLEASSDDTASIKEVTARILGLSPCAQESLIVSPVLGGNTNTLFCVSSILSPTGSSVPESVLVRLFGAAGLIDRDVETSTFAALAQQGLALAYFGRFANGRIEEWSDWKPLTEAEMAKPDISSYIAIQLARLHCCFTIPPHLLEYHNPQGRPTMWTQLEKWLAAVQTTTFRNDHDTERAATLQLDTLDQELQWLKESVISQTAKFGFCHNDVLASNILCSVPLQLIDFEYGGINYLAYDIANHFNEFAGGTAKEDHATPDYNRMPTRDMQRHFCRAYLGECLSYHQQQQLQHSNNGGHVVTATSSPSKEMERRLDALMDEVDGFLLANHLVWGLWGIHQGAECEQDVESEGYFDYLHYGSCRIRRYRELKEQRLQKNNGMNDST